MFEACGNIPVTTADKKENHRQQVFATTLLLRLFTANTSRVDSTETLLESQESQISWNRKDIVFAVNRNIPVTTADEKENHRQQVFATPRLF